MMSQTIGFLIALVGTGVLLYAGEWLRRNYPKKIGPEAARKLVHMSIGTFAAFWPFFTSMRDIQLISLMMFVVVLLSHKTKWFKSIYSVSRRTWGDLFFAMAIGIAAVLAQSIWAFTFAILTLALADGLAAIIGQAFGHGNQYKVFGHTKSVAGTLTFYICTLILMAIFGIGHGLNDSWLWLIWLPPVAAGLENLGVVGIDNLLVPIFIVLVIS